MSVLLKSNKRNLPIFIGPKFFKFLLPRWYIKILYTSILYNNNKVAKNLNDEIFFSYGSLSALINLICIKKMCKKIILVGCDYNTKLHFFEKKNDYSNYDKNKTHLENNSIKNKNIFTDWNKLDEFLKLNNIELYSFENNSEFVKRGFSKIYKFPEKIS